MRDFRNERGKRAEFLRIAVGSAGLLALATLAVVGVRAGWDMYGKFSAAAAADEAATAELATLQAQEAHVAATVAELSTERGQERAARQRYGVVRPGEGEIDVVRQAPTSTTPTAMQGTFWQRLWHALLVW